LLGRGYQYHGKDCSTIRAKNLADSVSEWVTDPTQSIAKSIGSGVSRRNMTVPFYSRRRQG